MMAGITLVTAGFTLPDGIKGTHHNTHIAANAFVLQQYDISVLISPDNSAGRAGIETGRFLAVEADLRKESFSISLQHLYSGFSRIKTAIFCKGANKLALFTAAAFFLVYNYCFYFLQSTNHH